MTDPTSDQPEEAADGEVMAAGGVVWRDRDGALEVLLVHRPRYDDWSLPKGKLDPGEAFDAAALREVAEETGVTGQLGEELGDVRYVDRRGRRKVVRWWALHADPTPAGAGPRSAEEVDDLRWCGLDEAEALVDYDTDREVLTRFRRARDAGGPPGGSGDTV